MGVPFNRSRVCGTPQTLKSKKEEKYHFSNKSSKFVNLEATATYH